MTKIWTNAKLNLFLHVNDQNPNGYHQLESLVVFCEDIYDKITISKSENLQINCSGLYAEQVRNNILLRTLKALDKNISEKNFHISIEKNIPIGAGLGGGSSNAAGLIKFLVQNNMLHLPHAELIQKMLEIGVDIPVCYHDKSCYFNNLGEEITNIDNILQAWAVVIFPETPLLTKKIFEKGFKKYSNKIEKKPGFDSYEELISFLSDKNNDLFQNALSFAPQLSEYVDAIKQIEGCDIARMTGSGSAIFGLFKEKKKAINAVALLKQKYKFYIKSTGLY